MTDHHFDRLTQFCMGCGAKANEVADARKRPPCPAFYHRIDSEAGHHLLVIISNEEKLTLLLNGEVYARFSQRTMFEVRDAIDLGVNQLRESGVSKAVQ